MFHKHNWDLIDKTVIPPAINRRDVGKVTSRSTRDSELFLDAFREHVVHVFKCDCGKVRTEKN